MRYPGGGTEAINAWLVPYIHGLSVLCAPPNEHPPASPRGSWILKDLGFGFPSEWYLYLVYNENVHDEPMDTEVTHHGTVNIDSFSNERHMDPMS